MLKIPTIFDVRIRSTYIAILILIREYLHKLDWCQYWQYDKP